MGRNLVGVQSNSASLICSDSLNFLGVSVNAIVRSSNSLQYDYLLSPITQLLTPSEDIALAAAIVTCLSSKGIQPAAARQRITGMDQGGNKICRNPELVDWQSLCNLRSAIIHACTN